MPLYAVPNLFGTEFPVFWCTHYYDRKDKLCQVFCNCSLRAGSQGLSGGGAWKERRACNYWLAEIALVMTSLPLASVFQCLFSFTLVSSLRWLAKIWQLSWQGATGELEVEFKFPRRSCKLSFLVPPHRQNAPESSLAGYLQWFKLSLIQRICYMFKKAVSQLASSFCL